MTDGMPTFFAKIPNPLPYSLLLCAFFSSFTLTISCSLSLAIFLISLGFPFSRFVVLDLHSGPIAVYCIFRLFVACSILICVRLYWFDGLKSSNHPRSLQIQWISGFFFPFSFACIFIFSLNPEYCMLRIYVVFLCMFFFLLFNFLPYLGNVDFFSGKRAKKKSVTLSGWKSKSNLFEELQSQIWKTLCEIEMRKIPINVYWNLSNLNNHHFYFFLLW